MSKCHFQGLHFKISVLKNFRIFTWRNLWCTIFLLKLLAKRPVTLLKKTPQHRWFPVKLEKFLIILFFRKTLPVAASVIFSRFFLLDQIPLKVRVSCWSSKNFAIDLQLWQKRLWYSCFPVIFAKFFRAPVLKNTLGRQLLKFFHNSFFSFE